MNWKSIDKTTAENEYNNFCNTDIVNCPLEFAGLRKDLLEEFETSLYRIGIDVDDIQSSNNAYRLDLEFGLKLHECLNSKYGFSIRQASTPGIWRFISTYVVPDIIAIRYGKDHPDRFWKKDKRLWLRVLWWYIHLSWQGTVEDTEIILKDNSTDEILQLVDRCGTGGYRIDLYREIMRQNANQGLNSGLRNSIFRKVMVLNTARIQTVEPSLMHEGVSGYVKNLYNYVK